MRKDYPKGVKVTDEQMKQLCLKDHVTQPARNYTLKPWSSVSEIGKLFLSEP